jgi:prepilin-type N-terminal cleavage/methylation domain-containing protein
MMETERSGFTVMEVFMVIVILCIVAAVAVPRVSHAAAENRVSDMVVKLHLVRSQVRLYRSQHAGLLPGQKVIGGDVTQADFIDAMTARNPVDGYGPYLKEMPANPFVDDETADDITCVSDGDAVCTGTEGTGWWLNAATGEFRPCDNKFHTAY